MSASVQELSDRTEGAFGFLSGAGFELRKRKFVSPESFKGGFVLTYAGLGGEIVVQYLDMQLEISRKGQELFGRRTHPGFSGNTFSRDHLIQYVDEIGDIVKKAIVEGDKDAV